MADAIEIGFADNRLKGIIGKEQYANGLAVIVTNDYTDCPSKKYSRLQGTRTDSMRMEEALADLNFALFPVRNGSHQFLASAMHSVSTYERYPESYGVFVFVFSGHGLDDGAIVMQNGEKLCLKHLIGLFQPGKAIKMAHWPKLFFIDACRGARDMRSILVPKGGVGVEAGDGKSHLYVPEEGNMLVAYSTSPTCRAYDHHEGGCWFPFLAKKLMEMDASVTDVLIEVNKEVLACLEKYYPGGKTQQPHFESTLRRNVFLLREARAAKSKRVHAIGIEDPVNEMNPPERTAATRSDSSDPVSEQGADVHGGQLLTEGPVNEMNPPERTAATRSDSSDPVSEQGANIHGGQLLTAEGGRGDHQPSPITPTSRVSAPRSRDALIARLGPRVLRPNISPVAELKELLQDTLKLEAPEYLEHSPQKTRRNQSQFCYTVQHQLLPESAIHGNWCLNKKSAKQNVAKKALKQIYEQQMAGGGCM